MSELNETLARLGIKTDNIKARKSRVPKIMRSRFAERMRTTFKTLFSSLENINIDNNFLLAKGENYIKIALKIAETDFIPIINFGIYEDREFETVVDITTYIANENEMYETFHQYLKITDETVLKEFIKHSEKILKTYMDILKTSGYDSIVANKHIKNLFFLLVRDIEKQK